MTPVRTHPRTRDESAPDLPLHRAGAGSSASISAVASAFFASDRPLDHGIAESALERKIGARGLRMIIEEPMLDLMYSLPHQKKLRECGITREIVKTNDMLRSLLEQVGEERGEPRSQS